MRFRRDRTRGASSGLALRVASSSVAEEHVVVPRSDRLGLMVSLRPEGVRLGLVNAASLADVLYWTGVTERGRLGERPVRSLTEIRAALAVSPAGPLLLVRDDLRIETMRAINELRVLRLPVRGAKNLWREADPIPQFVAACDIHARGRAPIVVGRYLGEPLDGQRARMVALGPPSLAAPIAQAVRRRLLTLLQDLGAEPGPQPSFEEVQDLLAP